MDFSEKLSALSRTEPVEQLRRYRHHLVYTTLDHSQRVARTSHRLAKGLGLRVDEDAMLRGAMLHDFYLYEPAAEGIRPYSHYLRHPGIALQNASRYFSLSEKEQNIILSHMWPINLRQRPRSREAWLVSVSDKLATVYESTVGLGAALWRRR